MVLEMLMIITTMAMVVAMMFKTALNLWVHGVGKKSQIGPAQAAAWWSGLNKQTWW